MLLYDNLAFNIHGKIYKSHTKKTKKKNLKYQLQHEMKSFNYCMKIKLFCMK